MIPVDNVPKNSSLLIFIRTRPKKKKHTKSTKLTSQEKISKIKFHFEDSTTPKPPANKKASGFQMVALINTPVRQGFIHSAALAIQHILNIKAKPSPHTDIGTVERIPV